MGLLVTGSCFALIACLSGATGYSVAAATGDAAASPVDCTLSEWSAWNPCSTSCDGGQTRRWRSVRQVAANGGKGCMASLVEVTVCNAAPCPREAPSVALPAGCRQMMSLKDYLPVTVYQNNPTCPSGRIITICYNSGKYSLAGMFGSPAKMKLNNRKYFGPGAPVKYSIRTVQFARDITVYGLMDNNCDIFQMGLSEGDAGGRLFSALPRRSVEELKKWSQASTDHVLLAFQSYPSVLGNYGKVSQGAVNPMSATPMGDHLLNRGPFGEVGSFNQGGAWKGAMSSIDRKACVLIKDRTDRPIAVYDRNLGSLFLSDVDMLTELGGLSKGDAITTANDRLLGNLYAFLIGIVCNGAPSTCNLDSVTACKGPPPPFPPFEGGAGPTTIPMPPMGPPATFPPGAGPAPVPTAPVPTPPTVCANREHAMCHCTGKVYYGRKYVFGQPGYGKRTTVTQLKNHNYKVKTVSGAIKCDSRGMGGDPAPMFYKYCYCEGSMSVPFTTITTTAAHYIRDCRFSVWAPWTSCNTGEGQRSRTRTILVANKGGGAGCQGSMMQTSPCTSHQAMTTDCQLGAWESWSDCSASCGAGSRTRHRHITQFRHGGGRSCIADLDQRVPCRARFRCPYPQQPCVWSQWSSWSACDDGQSYRHRAGNAECWGQSSETKACDEQIICEAFDWSDWSSCSATCGGGTRSRHRLLGRGTPARCKHRLSLHEKHPCNLPTCATHSCKLTDWADWSSCSATCGGGVKHRKREIARGKSCMWDPAWNGELQEHIRCNTENCALSERESDYEAFCRKHDSGHEGFTVGQRVTLHGWSKPKPSVVVCLSRIERDMVGVCPYPAGGSYDRRVGIEDCDVTHDMQISHCRGERFGFVHCSQLAGITEASPDWVPFLGQDKTCSESQRLFGSSSYETVRQCQDRCSEMKQSQYMDYWENIGWCNCYKQCEPTRPVSALVRRWEAGQVMSYRKAPRTKPTHRQRAADTREFLSDLLADHPNTVENFTSLLDSTLSRIFGASKDDDREEGEAAASAQSPKPEAGSIAQSTTRSASHQEASDDENLEFPIGVTVGAILAMVLCTGIAVGALIHARLLRSANVRDVEVRTSLVRPDEEAANVTTPQPRVATNEAE